MIYPRPLPRRYLLVEWDAGGVRVDAPAPLTPDEAGDAAALLLTASEQAEASGRTAER